MLAAGVARQFERIRPLDDLLRGAAVVDHEAAALRDGLSVSQAAQVVWTLASPEVHLLMTDTGGWSRQDYRAWLEQAIADGIVAK